MTRVLVVDDEPTLLSTLKFNLEKEGYEVTVATDGVAAIEATRSSSPDLIILDLLLPGMGGLEVCRILRQESVVPIIILTAKGDEVDKVVGIELGADDYVTKPFSMRELLARVKRQIQRAATSVSAQLPQVIETGPLSINLLSRQATKNGKELLLKPMEFDLLVFFIRHQGQVLTRSRLLKNVWGYEVPETRTVDVHVGRLREKIDDPGCKRSLIVTVRNSGYMLSA